MKDIHAFIHAKGLARVQLKEQDILTLLQTLMADGRCGGSAALWSLPCGWSSHEHRIQSDA